MPSTLAKSLFTVGEIAVQLHEPIHRITYTVKTRGIEPIATVGNLRVFSEAAIEEIADAIRSMDARREGIARCAL